MTIKRGIAFALIAILALGVVGLFSLSIPAESTTATPLFQQEPEDGDNDTEGNEKEDDEAPTGQPAITAEEAQVIAEAHLGSGVPVQEVELEQEHGQLLYSVEFSDVEVEVDAMTSEVLGTWADDD